MAEKSSNYLVTEARESFGKGAARKIRAAGKIPAVIYGHGTEPQHVTLPGHEVGLILRKANQMLELDIEGKIQLALVKDVQKDPVRQIIEHLDLIVVRKGEKVRSTFRCTSRASPLAGTIAELDANTLLARGRGHAHPGAHRRQHRGRSRTAPSPREGPHAARGLDPDLRPRDARRRRHRRAAGAGPGRGRRGGGRGRRGRCRGRPPRSRASPIPPSSSAGQTISGS